MHIDKSEKREIRRGVCLPLLMLCLSLSLCGVAYAEPAADGSESLQPSSVLDARIAVSPDDMFVDVQVPNHQVYLGEVMRIEYDVFVASSRGEVYYDVEEPDFMHWYSVEGKTPKASPTSFNGKSYKREPFAMYLVSATMPGKIALPLLKVQVPYVQSKPWITHSTRYIEVLPLPEPIPGNFSYGNVGKFEVNANISSKNVRVGEVVVVTVTVTGNAPVSGIRLAPYSLTKNADAFKLYPVVDDELTEDIGEDQLISSRKFRYRMLALKEGKWSIDPFYIVYFNPRTHQYTTASSEEFEVEVEASENPVKVQRPISDLLMIAQEKPEKIVLKKPERPESLRFELMFIVFGLFMAVLTGVIVKYNRQKIRQKLERGQKFEENLNDLLNADSADAQIVIMREILKTRYGVQASGTEASYAEALRSVFSEDDAPVVEQVMHDLRMHSYSTRQPVERERISEVIAIIRRTREQEAVI